MNPPRKILVVSPAFPSSADPSRGIFVFNRVEALSQLPGVSVRVISPTPWAPPLRFIEKLARYLNQPQYEMFNGLNVVRPRYVLPPKVGGYFHPQLMYRSLLRTAIQIRTEFEFDLIDAHWVYPSGVAVTRVGRRLGVPVCMTGRGEDMTRFPSMPFKGKSIRWALRHGDGFVGVSEEISNAMVKHGAAKSKTRTIPNGVDTDQFRPLPAAECKARFGIPPNKRVLLTVGDRLELKGFHLVIEALPEVLRTHQDVIYVCVGGPGRHGRDFTAEIKSRIQRLGLNEKVILAGPQKHSDLVYWYNAAETYVLASSREGSPNVLLEALACGVPAVATNVGGACDELASHEMGVLVKHRTAESLAESVKKALSTTWDRQQIRKNMEDRSWKRTAETVLEHFSSCVPNE